MLGSGENILHESILRVKIERGARAGVSDVM